MDNIVFETGYIVKLFENHRNKISDFYPSERWAFEKIKSLKKNFGSVLDVGCATGGLGRALSKNYSIEKYFGIDINKQAIEVAQKNKELLSCYADYECNDILKSNHLNYESYDNVFSLSCADWNIRTNEIIKKCWRYVKNDGSFVMSVRLSNEKSINNIEQSYQIMSNENDEELANYVIFNIYDFFNFINIFNEDSSVEVYGYGYWGKPASNVKTLYDKLVFSCFIFRKKSKTNQSRRQ